MRHSLALALLVLASGLLGAAGAQPREAEPPGPEPPGPEPVAATADLGTEAGAVEIHSETAYYDVEGRTAEALGRALAAHGPRIDGRGFFGLTEWEVSAVYQQVARAAGCVVGDLTVRMAVRTHLPRWRPPADAPPDVRASWERFVAALGRHERGHGHLAEEAAGVVRDRLAGLRAPCGRLGLAVQREIVAVLGEYEAHNRAYDAETGHGRTQHAVWPQAPLVADAH